MKIIVVNGPNLNLLGQRDKEQYGSLTVEKIEEYLIDNFLEISFQFFQSNSEGEIIDQVQKAAGNYDGLLINPGGYAHTSVAIHDALAELKIPKIEVHLSHLAKREKFRHTMVTAAACDGYISGFKENSYLAGVYLLLKLIEK